MRIIENFSMSNPPRSNKPQKNMKDYNYTLETEFLDQIMLFNIFKCLIK